MPAMLAQGRKFTRKWALASHPVFCLGFNRVIGGWLWIEWKSVLSASQMDGRHRDADGPLAQ